jgi:hypothetical protein
MSELMSSVRAVMRRMPARARLPGDVDRSAMLGVLALCAVLFMAAFAVSRATSPTSQLAAGATPRVVAARVSDQVPLRLTAAPAIQAGVHVAANPVRRPAGVAHAGARAQTHAQIVAPALTPIVTSATPVATVPARTAPAVAPEPAKAPEPRPRSAPPKKPSGGGGTSFDSSG